MLIMQGLKKYHETPNPNLLLYRLADVIVYACGEPKGIDEIIDLFSWLYFYQSKSAQSSANSNRAVWFICWKLLTYWADVHNFVYISILMADACKVDCSHCHFSMFVREFFFLLFFSIQIRVMEVVWKKKVMIDFPQNIFVVFDIPCIHICAYQIYIVFIQPKHLPNWLVILQTHFCAPFDKKYWKHKITSHTYSKLKIKWKQFKEESKGHHHSSHLITVTNPWVESRHQELGTTDFLQMHFFSLQRIRVFYQSGFEILVSWEQ